MRAGYMPEPGVVAVGDFPRPAIDGEGRILVRMELSSICGSDVHTVFDGFAPPSAMNVPGFPGHEGIGVVVESTSPLFRVGERVLTLPRGPEGRCFAEYVAISERFAIPVPAGMDPGRALLAQQYGTTLFAWRLFWPPEGRPTRSCVILGAGSAGLFFLQLARRAGFERIVVSDLNPGRRAIAARLGADRVVDPVGESVVEVVAEETAGAGADLVIEAAGYDALRAEAVAMVRVQGIIGLFGFPEVPGMAPFPQYEAFRKVARIQWSGGTQSEPGLVAFRDALREIQEGLVEVEHCREASYDLERLPEALAAARRQGDGAAKIQIELSPSEAAV